MGSCNIRSIRLVATDCDGVLTDGGLYYTLDGDAMRRFCVLDGIGFHQLKKNGFYTAIITAEESPVIQARAKKLGIDYLYMGNSDKLSVLVELCDKLNISLSEAAYIGDDIADLQAVMKCGFGACPPNAVKELRDCAQYVTSAKGGYGCFREFADYMIAEGR